MADALTGSLQEPGEERSCLSAAPSASCGIGSGAGRRERAAASLRVSAASPGGWVARWCLGPGLCWCSGLGMRSAAVGLLSRREDEL